MIPQNPELGLKVKCLYSCFCTIYVPGDCGWSYRKIVVTVLKKKNIKFHIIVGWQRQAWHCIKRFAAE